MKLFPVHPVLWSCLLVLCASQSDTEANNTDVCQHDTFPGDLEAHNPPGQDDYVEMDQVKDNFHCLLYPSNTLNCSWSYQTLQKDTHLVVYISICDGDRAVSSPDLTSEDRVGSQSLILDEYESLKVFLHVNITLDDQWTVYTSAYDLKMLEVLSPPPNMSASIKDGGLLVTWGLPHTRVESDPSCFEYQVDLGDQERYRSLSDRLSYSEPYPEPSYTYSVRMRTRKRDMCQHSSHWSDWSPAIRVEQSVYKLNTLVIVSISLGIPMILLALLLLVRHQRVTKVLFPPIPRPPQKYKHFLEKSDTFNFFYSAPPSAEPVEITEVEDSEQKPGKPSQNE